MSDGPAAVIVDSTGANIAEVKGASTAAVAADKALVVVVSPNNTVAVTDNGGSLTVDGSVSVSNFPAVQPVNDNGGSLTVDGTVAISGTVPISAASLPLPTGAATAALQTQPGVDIGDVTVNNAAGAAAVNIQDGGNSITVDGPLTNTELRASAVPVSVASLPLPTGAATAVNQTTVGNQTTKLNDGTTSAVIKAASTAAVAADPALVVAISPNNTVAISMVGGGYGGQVEGRAADGAAPVGNPVQVGGSDGTNIQTLLTDTLGRLVVAPAGVVGSTKGFSAGEVVLAATAVVPIRSTTYTEQAANATRSVASSSANDTSAGTGARTLRITYYTVTMTGPFTTDVTLNGTTAVATSASDICFIENIEVLTVGSTGSNVGIITLYVNNAGGGGTIWTIAATANQTKGAHHYCPAGKTCFITGLLIGIKGADTTSGFLRAKDPTSAVAAERQISDVLRAASSGQSFRAYGTAIDVVGPTRITVFAAPDSTSSRTYYGSFDFYEE